MFQVESISETAVSDSPWQQQGAGRTSPYKGTGVMGKTGFFWFFDISELHLICGQTTAMAPVVSKAVCYAVSLC